MAGTVVEINRNMHTGKHHLLPSAAKAFSDSRSRKMQGLLKKIKRSPLARPRTSTLSHDEVEKCNGNVIADSMSKDESEHDQLRRCERDIKSALQYYKVILEKGMLQKLPGTASVVLESVISVQKLVDDCFRHASQDQDLQPLRETLNRNVTNLIRLSDDVLFDSSVNIQPDKASAFRAVDSVLQSVHELCEFAKPRMQKLNLNAEFANYCASTGSSHSSSNSLEDVRETAILEDTAGSSSRKSSNNTTHLTADRQQRDSGIASEYSDTTGSASSYASRSSIGSESVNVNNDTPPAKPPLPSAGNRSYYGNQPFLGAKIRKAASQPDTIQHLTQQPSPNVHLRARPSSDFQTKSRTPFLDTIDKRASTNTSGSSRSSLDSCDSMSISPRRENFIARHQLRFENDSELENESSDTIDLDDVGMSDETYNQIQLYTARYEILATSSLSLFSDDGDTIFGASSPRNGEGVPSPGPDGPPVPPKKRNKNYLRNYFTFVENYNTSTTNERPLSFYDNCPVPRVHQIDEFQLLKDIEEERPPELPPKRGSAKMREKMKSYSTDTSLTEDVEVSTFETKTFNRSSPIIKKPSRRRSERDSTATYEEDHVPALDCLDVSRLLIFKDDGNGPLLYAGMADALLVYATECVESNKLYYEAFLATYRTFISPQHLICKLLYRANRFRDKDSCLHISHGALSLLVRIIDEMFEELDKSLFDQIRAEVHRLLNLGEIQLAKDLRDKIVNYCLKIQSKLIVKPIEERRIDSDVSIFDFRSSDIAEQMTMMDYNYFSKIELPEILAWGKEQSELLSPNLTEFIEHFNNMSYWCRTIILRESKQQERERLFKKFLKIMKHCRRLNNFSSYLAILSALDASPIRRLEWPKPLTEVLEEAVNLIDSSSAFKTYRQALSEAKPPCIPYLGLILQDITFIHLGNPNDLPDGKVNFVKRWQQYNILDTVRRFKEVPYDVQKDEKIMDFFHDYHDHMDEEEMWDKSQIIRPKGSRK